MKYLGKLWALCLLALVSTFSTAHPGHDHGHWSSPMIHALLFASIFVVVVAVAWYQLHNRKKNTHKREN